MSHLCPLRHGQKKALLAPEGLHLPGAEEVLLMLKVKILPVLCHDHGGCRFWRGRNLNYLRSLLQEEEREYTIRYGALRTELHWPPGHPPLVVIIWVSKQAKPAYLRQMWLVFRVMM